MSLSVKANILIKKIAKVVLDYLQLFFVAIARSLRLIDFPVPLNSNMRKTSSRTIRHYYISGICSSLPIVTLALREKVRLGENIRILDFGCGAGRQLLHFTRWFPAPAYYACDIDETHIDYITKNYPLVQAYKNDFSPPLKYQESFFDMIYSVSIFSHLCLEDQKVWLSELARVIAPGGVCFISTEGKTSLKWLSSTFKTTEEELRERIDSSGYLYKEYVNLGDIIATQDFIRGNSVCLGVKGSYGSTVLSTQFILKEWNTDYFEVLDIVEGIMDQRQDLVVLKRKQPVFSRS